MPYVTPCAKWIDDDDDDDGNRLLQNKFELFLLSKVAMFCFGYVTARDVVKTGHYFLNVNFSTYLTMALFCRVQEKL